jgi:Uma2 family endonuclease
MAIAHGHLSLEQFLAMPEEKPYREFIDGDVVEKMPADRGHSHAQPAIAELFRRFAHPRRLGSAYTEARFTVGNISLVPDVSYYRVEQILAEESASSVAFTAAPDIAAEILSTGQRVSALVAKCDLLLELGSQVCLLVEPAERTVLEMARGRRAMLRTGDDRVDLSPVLPDFELRVSALFAAAFPDWLNPTYRPDE